MFEIYPVSYVSLKIELLGLQSNYQVICDEIVFKSEIEVLEKKPFVQIGYDEISEKELDRLLDYRSIAKANNPIGFPCHFDAFKWRDTSGAEVLLFPLDGLTLHFKEMAFEVYNDYKSSGSMGVFIKSKGDKITVIEYLVAGSLECISFCKRHHLGLVIRW